MIQIAIVAIPASLKIATLVLGHLARRNLARNAAACDAVRVQVATGPDGTPIYVTSTKAVVDDIRRCREDGSK